MTSPRQTSHLTEDEVYLGIVRTAEGLVPYASGPQVLSVFVFDRWYTQRWDTERGEALAGDVEQFARYLAGTHLAQRRAAGLRVQACRPGDRAMLATEAGQALVEAAHAAMLTQEGS